MTDSTMLADELLDLAVDVLTDLEVTHAPGLELPRVLAGHPVGPDARADLAFTLGLLHEAGRPEVAGLRGADIALEVVRRLDGPATHTFYSYRAAETLLRFGGLDANPALAHWTEADHANAEAAIDSSGMLEMLFAEELPRNFNVVLARCELQRHRLGRLPDEVVLDDLVDRVAGLLAAAPGGWWDDMGSATYDIYTPDVYLFAEPLAARLGDLWAAGLRKVVADIDDLATPGGAISWGRSIGALGIVMTIELAAVATARELTDEPERWLGRAALALRTLRGWFSEGLVAAHQHRMTMSYRGPERRAQMTLDLLGKLVQAALELRSAAPEVVAAGPAASFPAVDRLVLIDPDRNAGVWTHRGGGLDFVVPLVGGFWADYSPAPRWPGTFEVPVGSSLVSMVPAIHKGGGVRMPAGTPTELRHGDGCLEVAYDGFGSLTLGGDAAATSLVEGRRRATYRAEGRTLVVDELLEIDDDPAAIDAVAIQIPEVVGRPLQVEFETDHPHTTSVVDVDGLIEYRSFWNEHARVHQIDLEPARSVSVRWRATPQLRVGTTIHAHWYNRSLYDPLAERVRDVDVLPMIDDPAALAELDLFHMHWPEWASGTDPDRCREVIATIRSAGLPIVWTQHNRVPHHEQHAREAYQIWAGAVDGVIHHSRFGRDLMHSLYDYRDDVLELVAPHGHWGDRYGPLAPEGGREQAERELGLEPTGLRLAVVGAPRVQKDVQLVIDAVHRCTRDDVQLCVWSLGDEHVPDDPRIVVADRYEMVDHGVYVTRLHAVDAIVMPFTDEMLTTGTVADCVAVGIPALVSPWPYLAESLGEAGIAYGQTADDLAACIDALTPDRLAAAAAAAAALRAESDWDVIAESTLAFFDEIVTR